MSIDEGYVKRKIALLGFPGVGKTSLATRFVQKRFEPSYNPTIENNFHTSIKRGDKIYVTDILDTAGLDGHSQISRHASIGVHGYVMMYSITSRLTLESIKEINDNLMHMFGDLPDIPRVLVASMCDLQDQRRIEVEEGKQLAEEWKVPFFECSAKEDINVDAVFDTILAQIERAEGGQIENKKNECVLV